jgi:DNA-binding PadR family transcriptional regulator
MLPKPLVTASFSEGQIHWPPGKLYPLLHSLENKGSNEAFWEPSEEEPDRKYYRLNAHGKEALAREKQSSLDLNAILVRLWGPDLQLQPGG